MTFTMWSLVHVLFIISPIIFTVIAYYATRNNTQAKNRKIGIIFSIICIVILALRNIEILIDKGTFHPEIVPLQICHFANFVLLFAFLGNRKSMFATAFLFNLPAALLSIVFANSLENYATIINFRGFAYIFGHMLIVGVTLWALLVGFIDINKKAVKNSVLFIISLFLLSIPVNNLFNNLMPEFTANYFYTIKPEGGTPLEIFFNWGSEISFLGMKFNPVYIITTIILGFVVYFGMYFMYKLLLEAKFSKNELKIKKKQKTVKVYHGWFFKLVMALFKLFKKKPRIYNLNKEGLEPRSIIVSNHSAASGPLTISLYFPTFFVPWGTHEMTEGYIARWKYLYFIFYRQKLGYTKFKSFILATLFGIISRLLYNGIKLIPTYKDMRLRKTLSLSKQYLDNGSSILIFPEDSDSGYHEVLLRYNPGFVTLVDYYKKQTKVDLPIYPMYFHKHSNAFIIGEKVYMKTLVEEGLNKEEIADYFKDRTNELAIKLFKINEKLITLE